MRKHNHISTRSARSIRHRLTPCLPAASADGIGMDNQAWLRIARLGGYEIVATHCSSLPGVSIIGFRAGGSGSSDSPVVRLGAAGGEVLTATFPTPSRVRITTELYSIVYLLPSMAATDIAGRARPVHTAPRSIAEPPRAAHPLRRLLHPRARSDILPMLNFALFAVFLR